MFIVDAPKMPPTNFIKNAERYYKFYYIKL